ncbi:uncharacterized protein F4812DRAFT_419821 [Daldinia caldariorum]|uniref:uncharacterized protein n=1 Tax=Daldinia caldariorum TaxID=326644 RepID=UPI002008619D|nr:uncharacterized protein F4812DRAFT_419821 [Daldinia caldariorum]KAI1469648.1 hypothetical protein F4812DRAFT_419821 [Daldinia caldariorum]
MARAKKPSSPRKDKTKVKSKGKSNSSSKGVSKDEPKTKVKVKDSPQDEPAIAKSEDKLPVSPEAPVPQEARRKRTPYKGVPLPHPGESRLAAPPPPIIPSQPITSPSVSETPGLNIGTDNYPSGRGQQLHRKRGGTAQAILMRRRREMKMKRWLEQQAKKEREEEENQTKAAQAADIPPPGPRVCRFCGVTFDPGANNACPKHQIHHGEFQYGYTSTKDRWTMEEYMEVKQNWSCCHKESLDSPGCA